MGQDVSAATAHRRRSAFTLIELLVVIGIIGMLMALLFPTIRRVQDQALATACASNLRQIALAMGMYIDNNHGYFFWRGENIDNDGMEWWTCGGRETGNANLSQGGIFNNMLPRPLNKYVGNVVEVFHCPGDTLAPWTSDPQYMADPSGPVYPTERHYDWVGNSYMFNAVGDPRNGPPRTGGLAGVKLSQVQGMDRTILFCDGSMIYAGNAMWHYDHMGNFCFTDWHIEFMTMPGQRDPFYKWDP